MRRSTRHARRRVVRFETLESRLPMAADFAATDGDGELIIDVLANDGFDPTNAPSIQSIVADADRGRASIVFEGSRIRYAADADFSGLDSLTYRAVDASGRVAQSEVRIAVRTLAVDAEQLTQWETETAAANEAWLVQLESAATSPLTVPDAGVLINRVVTVSSAKQVVGDGNLIQFTDGGRLIIDMNDGADMLSIDDARIVWQADSPPTSAAIDLRSGQLTVHDNDVAVAIPANEAAPSERALWLRSTGVQSTVDLQRNTVRSAYWNAADLMQLTGVGSSLTLVGNQISYFDRPVLADGLVNSLLADNVLYRNTGVNVSISNSTAAVLRSNRVDLAGGHAIEAVAFSNLTVADNVIVNSEGVGVRLSGVGQTVRLADNFIHASRDEGIRIDGNAAQPMQGVTLEQNVLAQNGGWAVSAQDVQSLDLNDNLIHQNRTDAQANQHSFVDVAALSERDNLQDQDNTSEDLHNRKTFGSNAQAYSFLAADNSPVSQSSPLALDLNEIDSLRPTASAAESQAFLTSLEGGGAFTVPAEGVVVDRTVTLSQATQILGGGSIEIVAGGELVVDMADPASEFLLRDTTVIWTLELAEPGATVDAVRLLAGRVTLDNNRVFTEIQPSAAHYANTNDLFYKSAPSVFMRLGREGGQLDDLTLTNNQFSNAYWYSTQLLKSSRGVTLPDAVVRGNEVRNYHGAIYLDGLANGEVTDNRLFRNSFGNVVVTGSGILISRNALILPGNGTSGDGITVGDTSDVRIEDNLVTNGTCYGVWFLNAAANAVVRNNVFHAGITSAINFDPATVEVLGLPENAGQGTLFEFEDIAIDGNLFSHNAALANRIVETRGVTLTRNLFQANNGDSAQNLLLGVVDLSEGENLSATDRGQPGEPQAYRFTSPHFVLQDRVLTVYGSPDGDNFYVEPEYRDLLRVRWGDWSGSYEHDAIDAVRVISEGGADYARIFAASTADTFELETGSVLASNADHQITLSDMSSVLVETDVSDHVVFRDSAGADTLYLRDTYTRLRGGGVDYRASGRANTSTDFSKGGADSVDAYFGNGDDTLTLQLGRQIEIGNNGQTHLIDATSPMPIPIDAGGGANRIDVIGTAESDRAELQPNGGRLTGLDYNVTLANIGTIVVEGNGGVDSALLLDSSGDDAFWARQTHAYMTGDGFLNEVQGFTTIQGVSSDGNDTARLFDSNGDDQLNASPTLATLAGTGFEFKAADFERVFVRASEGQDSAELTDSAAGNDRFVGRPTYAYLEGDEFLNQAEGFDHVIGKSRTGDDDAVLFDSAGDDQLVGRPTHSFIEGIGFLNEVEGFRRVRSVASIGHDTARLFDSAGDDQFVGRPELAYLLTDSSETSAQGFDIVRAQASNGFDRADFSDSTDADRFVARSTHAYLEGPEYLNEAVGFDRSQATAFLGGADVALLFDTPGDDVFIGRSTNAYINGGGLLYEAVAFPTVYARSVNGGVDQASLFASTGQDQFVARPTYAYLNGPGFLNQVERFATVEALNGQADDSAVLYGSAGDEQLSGDLTRVVFAGQGFRSTAHGFGNVHVHGMGAVAGDRADLRLTAGGQFVSRPTYDYLQSGLRLLQVNDFGQVSVVGDGLLSEADLRDAVSGDLLTAMDSTASLQLAAKLVELNQFSRVRARAAVGQSPSATTAATDFVLQLIGNWLF